jgi:hypothetical protein
VSIFPCETRCFTDIALLELGLANINSVLATNSQEKC